jgi:serine phosphatase RsbU (regulator of sigma subunit)
MATILYLIVAADRDTFTVASMGHLPPVVAGPDGGTCLLNGAPSPPVGAPLRRRPFDVAYELHPGTTVGCYTDGLIERRGQSIDQGLERLRAAFFAGPPEEVCVGVMGELVGGSAVQDDTALLVFRRV